MSKLAASTQPLYEQIPRSAYIHVPFCAHHCAYCNFSVIANRLDLTDRFLLALEREVNRLERPFTMDTLYIGGGTPIELPVKELRRLLELLSQWFPLVDDFEFTIEANPDGLTDEKLRVLTEFGVNRVSLGLQSLNGQKLKSLDRTHSPEVAVAAFHRTRALIENVSIDLIFAAPGESISTWRTDLKDAHSLVPNHISTYGLTYEPGTRFHVARRQGKLIELDDELQRSMYLEAIDRNAAAGFEHYEVSSFARPGFRSRHNQMYWSGRTYFAFGPGASRFVDGRRETNHRSTTTYIKRLLSGESAVYEMEDLTAEDHARDRLVFSLRRLDGIQCDQFHQETGYTVDDLAGDVIGRFVKLGLLEREGKNIKLSRDGLLVSDSLWPDFL